MRQKLRKFVKIDPPGIIPGFGLTLGVTLAMLTAIILIPLASLVLKTAQIGSFKAFFQVVTSRAVLSGYKVSLLCSFIAALINALAGLMLAWVLVRYDFPLKGFLNGLIELPFALPTSVAGISLTFLYSDKGWIGKFLAKFGIKVAYTRAGIIIAMIFVGIPFVVRSVQPVLEKLDPQFEEASTTLGASGSYTFRRVIFPELLPALLSGFGLAFARGIGEYGSVVFIAGNIPLKTQIAPLLIMTKLEQYKYSDATAIAVVLLAISFILMLIINSITVYMQRFTAGSDNMGAIKKVVDPAETKKGLAVKNTLVVLSYIFIFFMLIVPLAVVVTNSLRDGFAAYRDAVLDSYTISALKLTLLAVVAAVIVNTIFGVAAALLLSKYVFPGKQVLSALIDIPFSISPVIAGLIFILTFGNGGLFSGFLEAHNIRIVFAVPGIILATIFVTFPYVFRELFPVLNQEGHDEEDAAALMGASGATIFRRITFPHIKWAFAYGIVLCAARAMGEFGAVSVISGHLRGQTCTLPLQVEILFNEFNTTASFAVSSILVILAVIMLITRNLLEARVKRASVQNEASEDN